MVIIRPVGIILNRMSRPRIICERLACKRVPYQVADALFPVELTDDCVRYQSAINYANTSPPAHSSVT